MPNDTLDQCRMLAEWMQFEEDFDDYGDEAIDIAGETYSLNTLALSLDTQQLLLDRLVAEGWLVSTSQQKPPAKSPAFCLLVSDVNNVSGRATGSGDTRAEAQFQALVQAITHLKETP